MWFQGDADERMGILRQPLPKRLRPSETWETYIAADNIFPLESPYTRFRVLVSTDEIFDSQENHTVPPVGTAAVNIPPQAREAVEWVPSGKGMAGLALERGEPVQTCNLQEDRSGAVKLGAKAVNAQADIAMPVRNEGGEIVAVVGGAFAGERDIQGHELDRLQPAAGSLMERW